MAEEDQSLDDRTEEATPERREEFRQRGQVAVSREITSVFVLAASVIFFTFMMPYFITSLQRMFATHFEAIKFRRVTPNNILDYANETWMNVLWIIIPMFLVSASIAIIVTFAQTRFNFSVKRMKPDFSRLNIIKGIPRLVSGQSAMELFKGICKMSAVAVVSYLILFSEWRVVPGLLRYSVPDTWAYWGEITRYLFWSVAILLLFVGGIDYFYNFMTLERKLKMTKKEVKEEMKKREVDPHLKGRMRRMARELATRRRLEATEQATVLIANPTHYSVALKYELGMGAPMVVAKGIDHVALLMREVAHKNEIPIIENRPLARELYAAVEEGEEIPDNLYTVVAEIIRYVFRLKGKALSRNTATA